MRHNLPTAVRQFAPSALKVTEAPSPSMTIADIARVREPLKKLLQLIAAWRDELGKLTKGFRLDQDSRLGAPTREAVLALVEFKRKVDAPNEFMGRTNLEAINLAAEELQQMQRAALRVEGAVSAMGAD